MGKEHGDQHEREALQNLLAQDIEARIRIFLGDPTVDVSTLKIRNVWDRVLNNDAPFSRGRRDSHDIAYLIGAVRRDIEKERERVKGRASVDDLIAISQNKVLPETVVILRRQQIYNWKELGEPESHVTLDNVLAAADKSFYNAYQGVKKPDSGYSMRDVNNWYDTRNLIQEAMRIEEFVNFVPTDIQDVGKFGDFLQRITHPQEVMRYNQQYPFSPN